MLSEAEVRRWRDLERDRLCCLVDDDAISACKNIVYFLNVILEED